MATVGFDNENPRASTSNISEDIRNRVFYIFLDIYLCDLNFLEHKYTIY